MPAVRVAVLGLGNPLLGDDGVGLHVVDRLEEGDLPAGVRTARAEGSCLSYWDLMRRSSRVIAIDALRAGGSPGSIYLLSPEDLDPASDAHLFRHEDTFVGSLQLMASFGIRPEVTIVGVEPKEIAYSLELSPEIARVVPELVSIVRRVLEGRLAVRAAALPSGGKTRATPRGGPQDRS